MFLLVFFVLALVSVPLLGGALTRLADVRIAQTWAVIAALALQIAVITVIPDANPVALAIGHVVSYVFAGYFIWANRRITGLWIVGLGWAMNALVITANGGVMPATARSGNRGLAHGTGFLNSRPVEAPRLSVLGDNFALPDSWPVHNVFSIGDVFLAFGAFVVLHWVCRSWIARGVGRIRPTPSKP